MQPELKIKITAAAGNKCAKQKIFDLLACRHNVNAMKKPLHQPPAELQEALALAPEQRSMRSNFHGRGGSYYTDQVGPLVHLPPSVTGLKVKTKVRTVSR